MFFPIDNVTLLPLRGGFCESSQIPWALPSPWALPMASRFMPLRGVHAAAQTYNRPEGAASHQPNGNALGYGNVTVNIHNGTTRIGNECKTYNRPEGA
ncbi:MAG: hypothetical protein IJR53_09660 [Bacteroidales bacterium]|nr:hypothetical protein [Bacteroidales bacterium]